MHRATIKPNLAKLLRSWETLALKKKSRAKSNFNAVRASSCAFSLNESIFDIVGGQQSRFSAGSRQLNTKS
jgi:hypothetical protein